MVRFACCSLLLLAACPPKSAPATTPPPQPPGAGCPAATDVFVSSYLTQDAGKGRTGWVLPMHTMKVEANAQVADYQPLDQAAIAASGVPAAPVGNMWLLAGGQPCQLRLGGAYAAKIDGPPASISYGYEIDGCPAPADPQDGDGIVLVSAESPSGCTIETPKPIAERLGQLDAKQQWVKPENEKPIPPTLVPVIPKKECTAPGCETLWAIAQIANEKNEPVAWAGAVNWVTTNDGSPCQWKAEQYSGFFVPAADNSNPIQITDGQTPDHRLALSAALVDHTGAHVLIADGPGEYATYDLSPGKAALGHHTQWMLAPDEAWKMLDHLVPVCEPQAAPLPKDAKPVSPYP